MTHLVQCPVFDNGCKNKGRVGVGKVSVLLMIITCIVGPMIALLRERLHWNMLDYLNLSFSLNFFGKKFGKT